jgi:uncharacterized protein YbcI
MNEPIKVFLSYSHKDEELRQELISHLSGLQQHQGLIALWHDRNISAGSEWAEQIDENLEQADIILFLVSADFINSPYCRSIEMKRALERHRAKTACTIPVIIRKCNWELTDFHHLNGIPSDNRHVTGWGDDRHARDEAWTEISKAIGKVARQIWEARNTQAKQEFRAKAEIFYADGVMSPTEQRLLNRTRQELGLEEAAAEEILRVVAAVYQQHQTNLDEYRQTLIDELADQDELKADQRALLQQLQGALEITDGEAENIEQTVWEEQALESIDEKELDRLNERQHNVLMLEDQDVHEIDEKINIEQLILQFLKHYSRWFFNASRIRGWGAEQRGYESFRKYSINEIDQYLQRLVAQEKLRVKTSKKGTILYATK